MRFKGLDLNLLVVLDALMTEQNVTRAAKRINLSQSATSSALARLREFFGDELFVQTPGGFKPTPRALQILPALKEVLSIIERRVIAAPGFDPAKAERRIKVMASDFTATQALHRGLAIINRFAPGLRFELAPLSAAPRHDLESCNIDLLIAPENLVSNLHPYAEYIDDDYVCIVDRDNPIADRTLTLEAFLALPHAVVRLPGLDGLAYDDHIFEAQGHRRNITLVVPSHSTLPRHVVKTNRVAVLQRALAAEAAEVLPIRIFPVPLPLPRMREVIQWHSLNDDEPELKWVGVSLNRIQRGRFHEGRDVPYPHPAELVEELDRGVIRSQGATRPLPGEGHAGTSRLTSTVTMPPLTVTGKAKSR